MDTTRINFTKFNGGAQRPMEDRFWEKVIIGGDEECWKWIANTGRDGYGNFRGKLAHRVSWEIKFGKIPQGKYVCHHCDNPACVNPNHLFLGTQLDNMRDMVSKGRIHTHVGEENPKAKLKEKDVLEIYRLHNSGRRVSSLAKGFGVSMTQIEYIIKGKSWGHLWASVNNSEQ